MPKKNENKEASKTTVRDDEYYSIRLSNTQEAINQMDEGRAKNQMQYALDDVTSPMMVLVTHSVTKPTCT